MYCRLRSPPCRQDGADQRVLQGETYGVLFGTECFLTGKLGGVTNELKQEIRNELSETRSVRQTALVAQRAIEEAKYKTKLAEKAAAEELAMKKAKEAEEAALRLEANWKKASKIALGVLGVAVIGYGIYKVTPRVKKWWHNRNERKNSETVSNEIEQM